MSPKEAGGEVKPMSVKRMIFFGGKKWFHKTNICILVHRGVESFISANQFQYPRTWYVIS